MEKTAFVTGATRGIGKAIAAALSEQGFSVALCGRKKDELAALAKTLKNSVAVPADLSVSGEIEKAISEAEKKLGSVSVLINNAGMGGPFHRVDQVSDEEWKEIFATNVEAPFQACRFLLPKMKKNNFGRIINVSSIQGLFGGALSSTYSASKHALIGYTQTIAAEWGRYGIACNAVCPGYTETEMLKKADPKTKEALKLRIPSQRFGTPEEVAHLVAYLVGPFGGYVNGSSFVIDGGLSAHLGADVPKF